MKRISLFFVMVIACTVLSMAAGKKVAGSADGNVRKADKDIVYSSVLACISGNKDYMAFERNGTFINPLAFKQASFLFGAFGKMAAARRKRELEGNNQSSATKSSRSNLNGHEYVDLGLPSGLKWATMNVGATSPSDYGFYFAWGETKTKNEYSTSNSRTYERTYSDIGGNIQFDAARANWGGSWRLPTKAECEELYNCCSWKLITMGNHNGYKVIGPNGNYIFLPAAGYYREGSSLDAGETAGYWTSSPGSSSKVGYILNVNYNNFFNGIYESNRYYGRSVRPVSE